jgi:hypothetical protein
MKKAINIYIYVVHGERKPDLFFCITLYSFIVSLEKLIDFVYFSSASITIAKYVNKGSFKCTVHYFFFKYDPCRACE